MGSAASAAADAAGRAADTMASGASAVYQEVQHHGLWGWAAAHAWHAEHRGLAQRCGANRQSKRRYACATSWASSMCTADSASHASPPLPLPLQTVGAMSRTTVPGAAAKGGLQAACLLGSSAASLLFMQCKLHARRCTVRMFM